MNIGFYDRIRMSFSCVPPVLLSYSHILVVSIQLTFHAALPALGMVDSRLEQMRTVAKREETSTKDLTEAYKTRGSHMWLGSCSQLGVVEDILAWNKYDIHRNNFLISLDTEVVLLVNETVRPELRNCNSTHEHTVQTSELPSSVTLELLCTQVERMYFFVRLKKQKSDKDIARHLY
ncbi:hypothetical protein FGIG_05798 [Fasciola gigantica]|uniref:Uncharacterized protein n=1 Tax=Fasciola gigantica TaxID=46835 RepID=A0A504Z096_FASGI|nr:hypothetical protein FGIG_05798 [Fasciola gigantica]